MVVNASSKATTEIGESKDEVSTCKVLETLTKVGVDPTKILIGKAVANVMLESVCTTTEATCDTGAEKIAGPKLVGGACIVEDV